MGGRRMASFYGPLLGTSPRSAKKSYNVKSGRKAVGGFRRSANRGTQVTRGRLPPFSQHRSAASGGSLECFAAKSRRGVLTRQQPSRTPRSRQAFFRSGRD